MAAPGQGAGELGLLTGLDRGMLAAYCQAHALWVEAVSSIERYGTMVKSPNGYPMQSPYVAVANKQVEIMVPDRRRVRHDARLAQPHPGRRTGRRRIRSRQFLQRPWLEPQPGTTRSPPTHGRSPRAQSGQPPGPPGLRAPPRRPRQRRRARPALRSRGGPACDRLLRLPAALARASGPGRPSRSRPGRRSWSARLFGWQRDDGLRRFRTAYCAVPRKNGKSTLSAGIGALPAGRRRRAGRRDLLRRHHPRPGADRVRRGQAHGRAPRPRSSAGSRR